jgi:hypothetical protein
VLSYIHDVSLYVSIISPRKLLYLSVGSLTFRSLSSYSRFFNGGNSFVALLCTFSIAVISLILYGLQSALAYSKCGLT